MNNKLGKLGQRKYRISSDNKPQVFSPPVSPSQGRQIQIRTNRSPLKRGGGIEQIKKNPGTKNRTGIS
jgi:hypothetical protein